MPDLFTLQMGEKVRIRDIQGKMEDLEVVGTVTDKKEPLLVDTRFGSAHLAVAVIEDETGSIRLNLWRDQIEKVKVGDRVRLEGAFTRVFGGQVELNLGQAKGKITVLSHRGDIPSL